MAAGHQEPTRAGYQDYASGGDAAGAAAERHGGLSGATEVVRPSAAHIAG